MTASSAQKSTKVLIIGGGFTGVCAALELERMGIDYRLLEAHPGRLGGRAYSYTQKPPGGAVFEHGAQYIGQAQSEIWQLANEYAKEAIVDGYAARAQYTQEITVLNNQRYLYNRNDCLFGIDGMPPNLGVWNLLAALLLVSEIQTIERSINVVEPWSSPEDVLALDKITVAEWTARAWIPPVARDLVTISVQALLSVDPTEISAFYFFWYCACNGGFLNEINDAAGGPQQYYLSCGFDGLIDRVVQKNGLSSKIIFDSAARSIDVSGSQVLVTAQSATKDLTIWHADKVIVAMSPHTCGKITYSPTPPDQRRELMRQRMGRTIKCQVFYKKPWWRDSYQMQYSGYAGCASFPLMWVMDNSTTDHTPPVYCLMTFTVASFVDKLGPSPAKHEIEKLVTDTLAFLFNDQRALPASGLYSELVAYDWNESAAFSGGGPNTVFQTGILTGPGCPATLLNEPWNDKVFFASSETAKKLHPTSTSPYWQPSATDPNGVYSDMRQSLGYVDGAIVSGRYVASQVAKSLGAAHDEGVDRPAPAGTPAVPRRAAPGPVQPFTRAQIAAVAGTLCETFYAQSAVTVAAWEASKWASYPQAMMPWLANVVGQALAQNGIDPTPDNMEGVVGAAYTYSVEDPATVPPADKDASVNIKNLTSIFQALMVAKSAEPFVPTS